MAPPETAHKSMKPEPNPEAAETAQTTDRPAVVHERLVRRLGRFRISEHAVKNHPEDVMKIMGECLVIRCEMRYDTMTFDYAAISPRFDEVPEWQTPPEYEAMMERVNTGTDDEPKWETQFKGFFPTNVPVVAPATLEPESKNDVMAG